MGNEVAANMYTLYQFVATGEYLRACHFLMFSFPMAINLMCVLPFVCFLLSVDLLSFVVTDFCILCGH